VHEKLTDDQRTHRQVRKSLFKLTVGKYHYDYNNVDENLKIIKYTLQRRHLPHYFMQWRKLASISGGAEKYFNFGTHQYSKFLFELFT